MPQGYQGKFYGEDIDRLLERINSTPGSGAITAEDVRAAPEGYGLGTNAPRAPAGDDGLADPDLITKTGFYYAVKNLLPDGGNLWNTVLHINIISTEEATQFVIGIKYTPIGVRVKNNGTWGPWEWINPLMSLGVEYRTVERFGGSPVYVQRVNCGQLADGAQIEHGIENINNVIRYEGMRAGVAMPQIYNHSLTDAWSCYVVCVDRTKIWLAAGTSASGGNTDVTMWYTKTGE